ncbi:MAG TPA: hypothetical protein ENK18_08975 [Deltaproteobacteria bacterium]|nr:hypothetical protein [Deltaproteobacteria bacterium]
MKTINAINEPCNVVITRLRGEVNRWRATMEQIAILVTGRDVVSCVRAWSRAMGLQISFEAHNVERIFIVLPPTPHPPGRIDSSGHGQL